MNESSDQAGIGGTSFQLFGPGISACDAHGPGMDSGTTPLVEVQCGGSGGVSVAVDGCTAQLETHGLVHADWPHTVYLGPMTLDVSLRYDPAKAIGKLSIRIYTPKDVIDLEGTTSGAVAIDTCS